MSPYFGTSIGRLKMSEEASHTSGTAPASGIVWNCVPKIVLFDVTCA